jgi:uncharacterized membrane protein YdbT with pleckstrin-like domain
MSYIEENLIKGESVYYTAKLHWIIFIRPIMAGIAAALLFSAGFFELEYFSPAAVHYLTLFLMIICFFTGMYSLLRLTTDEFGVTNKRVIVKTGVFSINSVEILISKIEDIQVHQGFLGWIMGYGTITIIGTGGTKDPLQKISNPLMFRRKLQEKISDNESPSHNQQHSSEHD